MDGVKLNRQSDGKYDLTIHNGKIATVRRGLTMQEIIYELEMMPYTNNGSEQQLRDAQERV